MAESCYICRFSEEIPNTLTGRGKCWIQCKNPQSRRFKFALDGDHDYHATCGGFEART